MERRGLQDPQANQESRDHRELREEMAFLEPQGQKGGKE